ncbi:hypothetical protein M2387_004720 [Klebsiella sp. BIGb0407]|nr:hypothetical protein [Klebsiella sp. BIGb0407]
MSILLVALMGVGCIYASQKITQYPFGVCVIRDKAQESLHFPLYFPHGLVHHVDKNIPLLERADR